VSGTLDAMSLRTGGFAQPMITTHAPISLNAFGSDPHGLVHLTGFFQALARVTLGDRDDLPARVELCLDAAHVRGAGLESGCKYQARGAYRLLDDPRELPASFGLLTAFELLRHEPEGAEPTHLLLVAPFRVTIQTDGRATVSVSDVTLLPCPGGPPVSGPGRDAHR
jgi:hypothetical protein